MKKVFNALWLFFFLTILCNCNGQQNQPTPPNPLPLTEDQKIGGAFENREFMFIGMPENISSVDTSAGWFQEGQKLMITGTIFKEDGKTPAPNVILYYYHTDINGYYSTSENLDKRVIKHGYIRGWVKSDHNGQYSIFTVRPAAYPNSKEPAHIHPSIKEPGFEEGYWIDEFVFDDDIFLTGEKRKAMNNRGGSGVLRVLLKDDLQIAEHHIILGLNIPNYPTAIEDNISSGKSIGEDILSFTPHHAWGNDKGKKTCPICKYGRYHGILFFVGNHPNWDEIKLWLNYLESESTKRHPYLKAYFIYGNEKAYIPENRISELEKIGQELNLKNVALTFVPSFSDLKSEVYLNEINPEVNNTILLYKNRNIIDKYINLKPTQNNFEILSKRLDQTINEYFYLPEPKHE